MFGIIRSTAHEISIGIYEGSLTFLHRDLNGYSPPSRTTFFSLDI